MLVHGGQEFQWGPLVVAGDEITTTGRRSPTSSERVGMAFYVFAVELDQPARRDRLQRHLDPDRPAPRHEPLNRGTSCTQLRVTPDRYVTYRYAGASGRLQPDPPRRRVRPLRRAAGPHPPRPLHDGAGRARPDRGPRRARSICARSRRPVPRGRVPEQEIMISSTVRERRRASGDRRLASAAQHGKRDRPQRRRRARALAPAGPRPAGFARAGPITTLTARQEVDPAPLVETYP